MSIERKLDIEMGQDWQLAVTKEFQQIVKENSDFIPTVHQLLEKIAPAVGSVVEKDGVRVTAVYASERSTVYQVAYGEHMFALKVAHVQSDSDIATGFEEATHSSEAEKIIAQDKRLQNLKVRVIPFQLGYAGPKESFFVSQWKKDAWSLLRTLLYTMEVPRKQKESLKTRVRKIRRILNREHSFSDIDIDNCFYDSQTDELILFDLHQESQESP